MSAKGLIDIAQKLVARPKGILAADESVGTIESRLAAVDVTSTEEHRRAWRQLLFTAPDIGRYISGVILYDETIRQSTDGGIPFTTTLVEAGLIPGIKVDRSTTPLPFAPNESATEGLDGLRERLESYRELGAQFTKWRAVFRIGDHSPSRYAMAVNAHALGRFAAMSQETGLVPIVEPEVLMDGDHDIHRCFNVTEAVLRRVFEELPRHRVHLEGMLLKPSMVLPGSGSPVPAVPEEVGELTLRCLKRTVPAAVPGIVFLSGGQTDDQATENLNAIAQAGPAPWALTFSYGRSLQFTPLRVWRGLVENVPAAQAAFVERAKATSEASAGQFPSSPR